MWSRKRRSALISPFLGKEKSGNFKKPSSRAEEAAFCYMGCLFRNDSSVVKKNPKRVMTNLSVGEGSIEGRARLVLAGHYYHTVLRSR